MLMFVVKFWKWNNNLRVYWKIIILFIVKNIRKKILFFIGYDWNKKGSIKIIFKCWKEFVNLKVFLIVLRNRWIIVKIIFKERKFF